MDRRDFLKTGLCSALASLLPVSLAESVVPFKSVRIEVLPEWLACLRCDVKMNGPRTVTDVDYIGSLYTIHELQRILRADYPVQWIQYANRVEPISAFAGGEIHSMIMYNECALSVSLAGLYHIQPGLILRGTGLRPFGP